MLLGWMPGEDRELWETRGIALQPWLPFLVVVWGSGRAVPHAWRCCSQVVPRLSSCAVPRLRQGGDRESRSVPGECIAKKLFRRVKSETEVLTGVPQVLGAQRALWWGHQQKTGFFGFRQ